MMRLFQPTLYLTAVLSAVGCGSSNAGQSFVQGASGTSSGGSTGNTAGDTSASGSLNLTDSGETGAAGADGTTCGGTKLAASPEAVNVLLVVDKSSSMSSTPTGFGSSKWAAMQSALGAAIDATQGSVAFGLDFFPNSDSPSAPLPTVCSLPSGGDPSVPVGAGATTTAAIKKALNDNAPAGATPTASEMSRALDYFTKGNGAKLAGKRYVLLATDGGPNCDSGLSCEAASCTVNMDGLCPPNTNCCDPKLDPEGPSKCLDDQATLTVVDQLAKAGVKTFVVGIPGTEAYQVTLDSIAKAGGAANPNAPPDYFSVSAAGGVTELSQVLTAITTGLITTCDLALTADPPDHDQVNVVIDGSTIPEGSADGWSLDATQSPPHVILQGATCKTVETNGVQSVNVTFGCPTLKVK